MSTDYPGLAYVQAAGYTPGRPDGPPLWIVMHTMEAHELPTTAESTAAYFANPGDGREVSAHLCIDNNSALQCVRVKDTAWTVGNRPGNRRGINYEHAGFARQDAAGWSDAYSLAMLRLSAQLAAVDATRFGIPVRVCSVDDLRAYRPGFTTHNDLRLAFGGTTHTDPGPHFPWQTYLAMVRNALDGAADAPSGDDMQLDTEFTLSADACQALGKPAGTRVDVETAYELMLIHSARESREHFEQATQRYREISARLAAIEARLPTPPA